MVIYAHVDSDLFIIQFLGLRIKNDHTMDPWLHELAEYVYILDFSFFQIAEPLCARVILSHGLWYACSR